MRIAIVSDSHGSTDRLDILLKNLEEAGVEYLIHAGDFAVEGVLEVLARYPKVRVFLARGNADVNEELVEEVNNLAHCEVGEVVGLEREGIKVAAAHFAGVVKNEGADVVCHGHTHRAKKETRDGKLILNPGALCEDGKYFLLSLPGLEVEWLLFNKSLKKTV